MKFDFPYVADYSQKPLYKAYKIPVEVATGMYNVTCTNVYYRDKDGKLCAVNAAGAEDHEDAIISVKELLVSNNEYWEKPILALIKGGKK
jgi:hypothetical protein